MAIDFNVWCEIAADEPGGHGLRLLVAKNTELKTFVWLLAGTLPDHYAAPERVAAILSKFGKEKAAAYINNKMPSKKTGRSSDLGEIFATEYIDSHTGYRAPIKRLRWKDHREMALRGDDVIAIDVPDGEKPVRFLKAEAKSRATLNTKTVEDARAALDANAGMPSPHALSFVADRLHEAGKEELADLIDKTQLEQQIKPEHVEHLLFTFSGNAPKNFLAQDLKSYSGKIHQHSVGLQIKGHQNFIAEVYENLGNRDDT